MISSTDSVHFLLFKDKGYAGQTPQKFSQIFLTAQLRSFQNW